MQIDAGVAGRQKGHKYENDLADALNGLKMPYIRTLKKVPILNMAAPHIILLEKVLETIG